MKIIEINQEDMPLKLKKIKNPPKKLYGIGNINLLKKDAFAIVGTRKITGYGKKYCEYFTKELSLRRVPIISGMAIGTDTIVHKTVLENNEKTIAVLGSGFSHIFPKENITLFEEIVEKDGLIITEYEKNVEPNKKNFPMRNRIITALSEGVLVIEAGYRSGTSITAKHAKEQGKRVFAIPGKLDSKVGIGVNELIKKGAILTTRIEDILKYYPKFNVIPQKQNINKKNKEYEKIINILEEGDKSMQELIYLSNIKISEMFEILTNMELENIIFKNYVGKYALVEI